MSLNKAELLNIWHAEHLSVGLAPVSEPFVGVFKPAPSLQEMRAAQAAQQNVINERNVVMFVHKEGAIALPHLVKHLKAVLPRWGGNEYKYLQEILKKVATLDKRHDASYVVLKEYIKEEYRLV